MYNAIHLYRMAHWLWLHHVPFLPKLITLLIFLMYNSKIHYSTEIGRGTTLAYGGMSVLIHNRCKIGKNCSIGVHAILGGGNHRYPGVPTLGDNVSLKANAIVYGGVTIGDNAIVGANSVVNCDIPAGEIWVGSPARFIRKTELK